jgi:predicted nucleotidyltransferase
VTRLEISPRDLQLVREIVARHLAEREVRVIGSRVSGDAKPFSDLDLVVMGDSPMTLATLADLRDAFDESALPFAVDLVDWATASDGFRRVIETRSVPLARVEPRSVVP